MTFTALPITWAGRTSPFGPLGMLKSRSLHFTDKVASLISYRAYLGSPSIRASCIILRASDFAAGTRDVGFVGAQAGAARKAETRKI